MNVDGDDEEDWGDADFLGAPPPPPPDDKAAATTSASVSSATPEAAPPQDQEGSAPGEVSTDGTAETANNHEQLSPSVDAPCTAACDPLTEPPTATEPPDLDPLVPANAIADNDDDNEELQVGNEMDVHTAAEAETTVTDEEPLKNVPTLPSHEGSSVAAHTGVPNDDQMPAPVSVPAVADHEPKTEVVDEPATAPAPATNDNDGDNDDDDDDDEWADFEGPVDPAPLAPAATPAVDAPTPDVAVAPVGSAAAAAAEAAAAAAAAAKAAALEMLALGGALAPAGSPSEATYVALRVRCANVFGDSPTLATHDAGAGGAVPQRPVGPPGGPGKNAAPRCCTSAWTEREMRRAVLAAMPTDAAAVAIEPRYMGLWLWISNAKSHWSPTGAAAGGGLRAAPDRPPATGAPAAAPALALSATRETPVKAALPASASSPPQSPPFSPPSSPRQKQPLSAHMGGDIDVATAAAPSSSSVPSTSSSSSSSLSGMRKMFSFGASPAAAAAAPAPARLHVQHAASPAQDTLDLDMSPFDAAALPPPPGVPVAAAAGAGPRAGTRTGAAPATDAFEDFDALFGGPPAPPTPPPPGADFPVFEAPALQSAALAAFLRSLPDFSHVLQT